MKKIYALAAAAFMATSAMAATPLYITGANTEGVDVTFENKWSVDEGGAVEIPFDGTNYVIELKNLTAFTLFKTLGDWDNDHLTCQYGEKPGVVVDLEDGKDNIVTPWLGDYTVTVSGDMKTLTLATNSPKPAQHVYLRGGMNGWGAPEEWEMTPIDKEQMTFKFTCSGEQQIVPGEEFKVADASWGKYNFGALADDEGNADDLTMDIEADLDYNSGANLKVDEIWNGVCYFSYFTKQIVMSNDKEFECPFPLQNGEEGAVAGINAENNAAPVYYNLQGVQVNNVENGLYIVVKNGKSSKVIVK